MSAFPSQKNILVINSSYRENHSKSKKIVEQVIEHYETKHKVNLTQRDLANEPRLSYLNEDWINANFSPEKTENEKKLLEFSDELIDELKQANIVIFGCPMYNFSISSQLKCYIDLICRSGLTFNYTEQGPCGLLKDKEAVICTTSNGVPSESEFDFVTKYMKQIVNFIGIEKCHLITGNKIMFGEEEVMKNIKSQIQKL